MKELATILNFGQVIAYLIPGFIGIYALSRFSKFLNKLILTTENQILQLNTALILILMSIAVGLIISAARMVLLDNHLSRGKKATYRFDYKKLLNADTRIAYDNLVLNSWRFAQFYGNMVISISMLIISNFYLYQLGAIHNSCAWTILLFITTLILFVGYKDHYNLTHHLANIFIGV